MTRVAKWVIDLCEEAGFKQGFKIGDKLQTSDGRTVQIVSGQFWGEFGLSNFWDWREVLDTGELSDTLERGYGILNEKGQLDVSCPQNKYRREE